RVGKVRAERAPSFANRRITVGSVSHDLASRDTTGRREPPPAPNERYGLYDGSDHPAPAKLAHDEIGCCIRGKSRRFDMDLRLLGDFIRRIDSGEVLQFALSRLLVQPLGIALLGHG